MICPKCESEFVDGIVICSDCKVPLVEVLPEKTSAQKKVHVPEGPLFKIPLYNDGDAALIQSLLEAGGFRFYVKPGFAGSPDEIFIQQKNLKEIKDYLSQYRIRPMWGGELMPIQW